MPEEPKTAAMDRLFRERRFLLGVSVVLLAHQLMGITVNNSAESLGLHFSIDNPERLFAAVWVVWVWSFICYVQQLNSIRPFQYFPRSRTDALCVALVDRFVLWKVMRRVRQSFHRQVSRVNRCPIQTERPARTSLSGVPTLVMTFSLKWKDDPDDPTAVRLLDERGSLEGCDQRYSGDLKHRDGTRGRSGTVSVPLNQTAGRGWLYVLAVLWTWGTTSFATDYLAPVAIGLAPAAIACYSFVANKVHLF